jgi:DNA-binding GntR family transcriptional regulator
MDLIHIYQVRGELEPLAWFLAAAQMNQQTLDELRRLMEDMRDAARKGDYRTYSSLDYRFHCTIWESQGNRYLEKSLKALCPPIFAHDLVHHCSYSGSGLGRALRQHERLLAVLQMGDPSLVLNVVRRMMRKFLRQDLTELGIQQSESTAADDGAAEKSPLVKHSLP